MKNENQSIIDEEDYMIVTGMKWERKYWESPPNDILGKFYIGEDNTKARFMLQFKNEE